MTKYTLPDFTKIVFLISKNKNMPNLNCRAKNDIRNIKLMNVKNTKKISSWTGFEPVREYPIGFRVQRLNHSAITTWLHGTFVLTHQINDVKEVCSKEGKNCVVLFEHILRRIICILNRESRWRRENIHKNIFCGLTPPTKKRN